MSVRDYINLTPCSFFEAPPVKRCLMRFIRKYGSNPADLISVATQDSATVTWQGTGTPADPLIATAVGSLDTLQTVTNNGNTTTNSIIVDATTSPSIIETINGVTGNTATIQCRTPSSSRIARMSVNEFGSSLTLSGASCVIALANGGTAQINFLGSINNNIIQFNTGNNLTIRSGNTVINVFGNTGTLTGADATAPTMFTTLQQIPASVRSSTLTGFVVGTNTAITATNTVLQAFQFTQGQINARAPLASPSFTGKVGINVAPVGMLHIGQGTSAMISPAGDQGIVMTNNQVYGTRFYMENLLGTSGERMMMIGNYSNQMVFSSLADAGTSFVHEGIIRLNAGAGTVMMKSMVGTGTRMVVTGADGTLSSQELPAAGATPTLAQVITAGNRLPNPSNIFFDDPGGVGAPVGILRSTSTSFNVEAGGTNDIIIMPTSGNVRIVDSNPSGTGQLSLELHINLPTGANTPITSTTTWNQGMANLQAQISAFSTSSIFQNSRVDAGTAVTVGADDHIVILTNAAGGTLALPDPALPANNRRTIKIVNATAGTFTADRGVVSPTSDTDTEWGAQARGTIHCINNTWYQIT